MTRHAARIETPRLVLLPLAEEHAPALHAIFGDPEATRFWHFPPFQRLAETEAEVARLLAGAAHAWVLTLRESAEPIGLVYFLGTDQGGPGDGLGYILHPGHWRRGLMSEAVRAAVDHGFGALGLERIELWIDMRNVASRRLASSLGFIGRSSFRQKYPHETQSHEKLVFGLTRRDLAAFSVAPEPAAWPARGYAVQPVLAVPDVGATAAHYRDVLGFRIAFLFGDPPTYGAVTLRDWSASGISIHLSRSPVARPDAISLYLDIGPGIDAYCEGCRLRGAEIVSPPGGTPWGQREFVLRDCNGYLLRFGTPG